MLFVVLGVCYECVAGWCVLKMCVGVCMYVGVCVVCVS